MTYKICTECNKNKLVKYYYRDYSITTKESYRSKCKQCCQKQQQKRKSNEKDKTIKNKICKDCVLKLPISQYYKNARYKDGYFARCKKCHDTKEKTGYIIKRTKEYMKEYNKKRYSDPRYIIRSSIRKSIIYYSNKSKNNEKSSKYIGCTVSFFKTWIEYQFKKKMTWENHGSYWHFDHVKPCASFDLSNDDEILKCYNWTNYQPLKAIKNLKKSDIIIPEVIKSHKNIVKKFKNENSKLFSSASTLKNRVNCGEVLKL